MSQDQAVSLKQGIGIMAVGAFVALALAAAVLIVLNIFI